MATGSFRRSIPSVNTMEDPVAEREQKLLGIVERHLRESRSETDKALVPILAAEGIKIAYYDLSYVLSQHPRRFARSDQGEWRLAGA